MAPKHLRWATAKENWADRWAHGTTTAGSQNPAAKLTADDVRRIREIAATYRRRYGTNVRLAEQFGVHPTLIGHILHRRAWAWLD